MKKRIVSTVLCLCLLLSALVLGACADVGEDEDIVILYENDVHCAVEGYSKLAAMKKELAATHDYVGVVSSGDFVQGGTLGAVSKGEYIVNLMNLVGYDAIALGNHEFDHRLPRLEELNEMSHTEFLSCNFGKIGENTSYFDPYTIVTYGSVDIAYIGITTPRALISSFPTQFKNEEGEYIYTFHETVLCDVVQDTIDAARADGADYVIALSHLGYGEESIFTDVTDVICGTEGLDAVLDAHSHSVIEGMTVKNKEGEDVLLSSTGTKFAYIGKLTLSKEGLSTELIETASYEKTDAAVDAYIAEINESYAEYGNRVVGNSLVALNTHHGEDRLVRKSETALGNFCSDAIRATTGANVAYVNGGGLRASLAAGEVTFNDIYSVFSFNNQLVTAEITGQCLLDMIESTLSEYPEEKGGFPSASGITFSVNTAIPSSVQFDENNRFVGVNGDYRVYNVRVYDVESGTYQALELDKTYVIAGFSYHIADLGGGLMMLKDAKNLQETGILDVEALEYYITDHLGGVIGEEYAHPQGRITFTEGYDNGVLYEHAVLDAQSVSESELEELVTVTEGHEAVTWSEDGERVLLLSWHKHPERYEAGESFTLSHGVIWTFADGEICAWYEENGEGVADWDLRLAQLIGLPPKSGYTHVSAFWVELDELARPAYQPDITEQLCPEDLDGSRLGSLQAWFDQNAEQSYSETGGYPWTRLGYTYDWAMNGKEYGLTEFIVLEGSEVEIAWTKTTSEFLDWLEEN